MPPYLCEFSRRPLRLILNILRYAYFGYLPFWVFTLNSTWTWRLRRLLRRYCFSSYRYRRVMGIGAIDSERSRDSENHVSRDRISLLKIHVLQASIQRHTLRFAVDHRSYRSRDPRCPITFNKRHFPDNRYLEIWLLIIRSVGSHSITKGSGGPHTQYRYVAARSYQLEPFVIGGIKQKLRLFSFLGLVVYRIRVLSVLIRFGIGIGLVGIK